MSLFNFFRKSEKEVTNTVDMVDPNLFAESTPPVTEQATEEKSALSTFLEQDYNIKGINDGYLYANAEVMDATMRKLRSEFRKAVDKDIDKKRAEILELRLHAINSRGITERMDEAMAEKIKQLENLIHQLDLQKNLSIEDEGMVSSALHDYRIGFIKGTEQYSREKFLCGSTGLFNS